MELAGRVVIVPVEWVGASRLASRMAAGGATVVLVGLDGEAAGRLAAELEPVSGGRLAVFVTDGSPQGLDALAAFVSELFRGPSLDLSK